MKNGKVIINYRMLWDNEGYTITETIKMPKSYLKKFNNKLAQTEKYVKEHSMKYLPAALLLRDSQVYIEYVYVYTYTDTHIDTHMHVHMERQRLSQEQRALPGSHRQMLMLLG